MAKRSFRQPPKFFADVEELVRKVVLQIVTDLLRGKTNNTFEVTLAVAPATSTTLLAPMSTEDSEAFLTPKTATAAIAIGAGVVRTQCLVGSVVITHDASVSADRTFGVVVVG
jgi:hypothetical protein